MTNRKVKLTGERSLESKLHRLAYELEQDASRVRADYGSAQDYLANSLKDLSSTLGRLARLMAQ